MKLRNKKSGEVGVINLKVYGDEAEYCYDSLETMCDEWEDYTPKEPLIRDKELCKRIKELAKFLGIEPDASVWVDTSDSSNIKLEFRISFMNTYYLEFCSYATDTCIKTDYYTIEELCGSEE